MLEGKYYMPYQPNRTRHNMRPNWVRSTSLVMEITQCLGSPSVGYLRGHNYSDLHELKCDLSWDELRSLWQWSAWRIRNQGKRIMTCI